MGKKWERDRIWCTEPFISIKLNKPKTSKGSLRNTTGKVKNGKKNPKHLRDNCLNKVTIHYTRYTGSQEIESEGADDGLFRGKADSDKMREEMCM